MKLTLDFESRSKADLKKIGAAVYAEHPSTEIMCAAIKIDGMLTGIWIPDYFKEIVRAWIEDSTQSGYDLSDEMRLLESWELLKFIEDADAIEAHNAFFERVIWENICVKRLGWSKIPVKKWRCSAAKAAAHGLPRALEGAGEALNLPIKKDKEGHRIMLKLCKPRKPTKHDPSEWHEKPEDLLKLFRYCIRDVEA